MLFLQLHSSAKTKVGAIISLRSKSFQKLYLYSVCDLRRDLISTRFHVCCRDANVTSDLLHAITPGYEEFMNGDAYATHPALKLSKGSLWLQAEFYDLF